MKNDSQIRREAQAWAKIARENPDAENTDILEWIRRSWDHVVAYERATREFYARLLESSLKAEVAAEALREYRRLVSSGILFWRKASGVGCLVDVGVLVSILIWDALQPDATDWKPLLLHHSPLAGAVVALSAVLLLVPTWNYRRYWRMLRVADAVSAALLSKDRDSLSAAIHEQAGARRVGAGGNANATGAAKCGSRKPRGSKRCKPFGGLDP